MLHPERMTKLQLVGPIGKMERIVKDMHALKAVHITTHTQGEMDIGTPSLYAEEFSESYVAVRALMSTLKITEGKKFSNGFKAVGVRNFRELKKEIETARVEIGGKEKALKDVSDSQRSLKETSELLNLLAGIDIPLSAYTEYKSMAYMVATGENVKDLQKELMQITQSHELKQKELEGKKLVVIFVALAHVEKTKELLNKYNFSEIDVSKVEGMEGLPSHKLKELNKEKVTLQNKITKIKHSLTRLKRKWSDFLMLSEQFLQEEMEKAEAPLQFAATKNIFVASGWVPFARAEFVQEKLQRTGVKVTFSEPQEKDEVPIKLNNPKPIQPFEFFMRLYALPKYGEIDPTFFFSIMFPVFFGFILGDVGYGLTTLALFWFLKKKMPAVSQLLNTMMLASLSSIVFGLLFGEVFGAEVLFGYHLPHILSRLHQINELLMIALVIGVAHVNVGLLLGVANVWKEHGLKEAIYEKVSWMGIQAGAGVIGAIKMGYLNIPMAYAIAVLVISLILLYKGESFMGIIELPAIFSNIISYARLMAVGVASVALAAVVNEFAADFFHKGGIFLVFGVLILVVGHTLNIALGILGGFLHSIRLHYVEFFTKFFKGGADPYIPFGNSKENITKEG